MTTQNHLKSSISLLSGLLSTTLITTLYAETLPVMVVTPTRIAMPLSESPVPVDVISREEIENSLSLDVADIIKLHTGIEIARNGGYGKVTSLFVRGTDSNHTVVLIDGVKINPATIGASALQNISPSMIDHIEIVKGPRSSVYGSEAIGGVINIITRKHVSGTNGSLTVGVGDNASQTTALDFSYGNEDLSIGLVAESFSTDGFPVSESSTQDHGYDNDTVNAFINYELENQQFHLSHWQANGNVEYYYFGEQNQDFHNNSTVFQWDMDATEMLSTSFRISQISDEIEQQVANFLAQFDKAETNRDEFDIKVDYAISSNSTVSFGFLKAVEKVDALSFGTVIDEETDIDEVYALYQSNIGDHNYSISFRNTDHEDFGKHDTWNVDYQYSLDENVRLYTGIGTAFRAPDNTDRFGFIGNADLLPETSRNIELGLIFNLSEASLIQLSVFKNSIEDLIEPNAFFTQMVNVDEVEITGVEFSLNHQLDSWHYKFNAVLQNPENSKTGELLSRRAESRINMQVSYQQPEWQITAMTSLISARDDSPYSDITLPAYELVDLNAYYNFSKHIKVSAKVDNLFNEQYETAAGFNTKDRTLMVELKYSFLD